MSNYQAGHVAEKTAAEYLKSLGYKILELNWRSRYAEIDIIAQKSKTVYFIEVKYRLTGLQGDGFDYITKQKLKQMHFAAEIWLQSYGWEGEACIGAIAIDGQTVDVTFIEDVSY